MRRYFVLMLAAVVALGGCMDMGSPAIPPILSFKRFQPIYMSVSDIQVIEEYKSPMRAPNIEHQMPYSPADAMQIWVKDRLKTTSGERTMQIIIKDASVISKEVPKDPSFFDKFDVSDKQYDARLEVEMRIYGAGTALSEANINVVATRMLTLGASLSARSREDKLRKMMFEMMDVMNAELEKNIYQHLGSYVNYSITP